MPLSTLTSNRKDGGNGTNGRATHLRVEELGQQPGSLTRSGSESDSLLDLYRRDPSSGNVSQQAIDNDIPENMYRPQNDDPEGWIHRDKLAKIESEELQAAGINLANARRNLGKTPRRETSRGRKSEDKPPPDTRVADSDQAKSRLADPLTEEDDDDDPANWDIRTPEEIAADNSSAFYSNPVLRKSGSKIPVLTSSPLPISQDHIERDTPLVRKRTISNSMGMDDATITPTIKMRRGSTSSQRLGPEDLDPITITPTPINVIKASASKPPSSPTKTKPKSAQNSPLDASTGRKTSGNSRKPSTNAKGALAPSPNQRPGTRSGDLDRPRTAINRPEGDPPWLATMYKPDPRLPPEEQIIPTHARRQQQAQWDEEGAIPTTYDRNFSPLAIHTGNGLVKDASPRLESSPDPERDFEGDAWPLRPVPGVKNLANANHRPGTGGSGNAGYSTMPRVASPAVMTSPRMGSISSGPGHQTSSHRIQVQRMPQTMEDEKTKDKSCGCCVVM
ncbi:hypothetical protein B0A52_05304 [Exophiala mesophila]|uniref:TeaA receptor TeaR n=1 Tax=Exophiala mesophila TaxID=212818 RepID=A0A438N4Q3_EXOME|nr:hypothetical protein B0A52_05304 [Exophiala mesophila]